MDNQQLLSPHCKLADYKEQRIPQFRGNPLIEALPLSMSDDELVEALKLAPPFDAAQRTWSTNERIQMLTSLQNFMVPLDRHLELARALDSLLRAGYVGRAPRTPDHARIYHQIYGTQKAGKGFVQRHDTLTPQLSTSLIGISGMGKSTAVARWSAHLDRVIYHPKLNIYQIPYLHVEMPDDGSTFKGLAHLILQQVDELIPGLNYYEENAVRGRPDSHALMGRVARVLNTHFLGLLVCDEMQNLENARSDDQRLMTQLVSASNMLKLPIAFIGANKAAKILGRDFRQARRSSGHGIAPWDRMANDAEWVEFVEVLWSYQWLRKPVPLSEPLRDVLYDLSQGVLDIAIKLFAVSQARAIIDGAETLSLELLHAVYRRDFRLLHPMLAALRANNLEALANYDDVAPFELDAILATAGRQALSKGSPLYGVKSTDPTYIPRVVSGLVATGFGQDEALAAAKATVDPDRPSHTLLEGVKTAIQDLTVPKKVRRTKELATNLPPPSFDERPLDYRRALYAAHVNGTTNLTELKRLEMVRPLEEVLELT